jgi:hypothetical protein
MCEFLTTHNAFPSIFATAASGGEVAHPPQPQAFPFFKAFPLHLDVSPAGPTSPSLSKHS